MPEPLVFDHVTAGYGGEPAVREVSFQVGAGEVVGLVGPNGSGKTTIVRLASRTIRPESGSVLVCGRDPYDLRARVAARRVAVVPQDTPATFPFTVLEVVLMGRAPHLSPWGGGGADDYRLARDAMEEAGVHALADRTLDSLSGGERQRVTLAQALAQDAPVLLLDEPTTHLDLHHVVAILETVRRLASEGRAVLSVFHDLNLASAWCDRLVVMDRGTVVAEGRPQDVVTASVLRDVYRVEAELETHPVTGRPVVLTVPPRGGADGPGLPRAHVVGGAGRGAAVMRALGDRGFEVTAGVLHGGDTDAVAAERLNLARVAVPPFSVVEGPAEEEVIGLIRGADVVIVCDAPYGPGNLGNLRAALRAARDGVRVVLVAETPIEGRDFTGGEAARLWNQLAEIGTEVASQDAVVEVAAARA